MVLIIGGAYQGKRQYARDTLGFSADDIVPPVDILIRDLIEKRKDPLAEIRLLAEGWRDKAVLLTDVNCGIVPVRAEDRAFREAVGRCGTFLASRAEKVIRVFCGLGTVIKGA